MCTRNFYKPSFAAMMLLGVAGCSSLGGAGPSTNAVRDVAGESYADAGIAVIELDSGVIAQLNQYSASNSFAELFDDEGASETLVGRGDTLDIAIWEAPPAVLFGTTMEGRGFAGGLDVASSASIPSQQVGDDGKITVPFIGRIEVLGLRPDEVERIITSRLAGRANNPQAVVRLVQNESRTATILGKVQTSQRVVLTARGERLLDALASAGGTSEEFEQSTVQLARGTTRAIMPPGTGGRRSVAERPAAAGRCHHRPAPAIQLRRARRSRTQCRSAVRRGRRELGAGAGPGRRAQ